MTVIHGIDEKSLIGNNEQLAVLFDIVTVFPLSVLPGHTQVQQFVLPQGVMFER